MTWWKAAGIALYILSWIFPIVVLIVGHLIEQAWKAVAQ